MKIPHDVPDWLASLIDEMKRSLDGELISAKNTDELLLCQGRARAIVLIQNELEMRAIDEEAKSFEIAGRITEHGE